MYLATPFAVVCVDSAVSKVRKEREPQGEFFSEVMAVGRDRSVSRTLGLPIARSLLNHNYIVVSFWRECCEKRQNLRNTVQLPLLLHCYF